MNNTVGACFNLTEKLHLSNAVYSVVQYHFTNGEPEIQIPPYYEHTAVVLSTVLQFYLAVRLYYSGQDRCKFT